jgi:DNA-binding MarR family transcriptional regulator
MCNTESVTSAGVAQNAWDALPYADRFAWLTFRRAAVELIAVLDADLQTHVQIGFADFDALIRLLNAPDRTMRMADLARSVSRSPSALTRMVSRLETRGLVSRNRHSATEVTVAITQRGLSLLDEAAPRHLALVDQLFWSPLTPEQRTHLGALCQQLIEADCATTSVPGERPSKPMSLDESDCGGSPSERNPEPHGQKPSGSNEAIGRP